MILLCDYNLSTECESNSNKTLLTFHAKTAENRLYFTLYMHWYLLQAELYICKYFTFFFTFIYTIEGLFSLYRNIHSGFIQLDHSGFDYDITAYFWLQGVLQLKFWIHSLLFLLLWTFLLFALSVWIHQPIGLHLTLSLKIY